MSGDILFLAHRVPYPPNRGDKIRSWNVLKALSQIAPVHVAALCDDPADLEHAGVIESVCASTTLIPHRANKLGAMARALATGGSASVNACRSPALAERVEALIAAHPIRAIYAFSGQMAQYVPVERSDARFVMDFVDMDSAKFAEWGQKSGVAGLANRFEAARLFAFERNVAARADVSLFVSEAEAQLFREATSLDAARVRVLENGIDLERFHPGHTAPALEGEGPHIVFTGQMDYAPNVEAVSHFARNVMPSLLRHFPAATFWIVGRAPVADVLALATDHVRVTGAVDEPRDWLAAADLVVAPLLLARGVQNKVLEAMAIGKAVLASSGAAEGIDAAHGHDLVIADGIADQIAATTSLLLAPQRRQALGKAARARMEARYGWNATLSGLPDLLWGDSARKVAA